MLTYQDLLAVSERDTDRANFVREVIAQHKSSDLYKTAVIADAYDRCRNTTIMEYQKTITTVTGQVVPDNYSATHRSTSNFFNIITTQISQYLLGNGVQWVDDHEKLLGKDFDQRIQEIGHKALCGAVCFGFFNLNRIDVFSVLEFAPLYDEETGALSAGVRFWRIDNSKPLRAVLYELDGCTQYLWADSKHKPSDEWTPIGDEVYMKPKTPYSWVIVGDAKDREEGTVEIKAGESANGFPIIPMYSNPHKQSELIGLREKIDAYDFILNGFEDDLDNAQLYWIIKGAGGMDDPDIQQFLDRLKTIKAAAPADGQDVQPVQVDIPYEARERLLDRLEKQIYRDAMIMNSDDIASGSTTATHIEAAYERQNIKADQFEFCVLDFLNALMKIAGIDDNPTFTRSKIVNVGEEIQNVINSAQFLTEDYVTQKILTLLGDGDKADEIIKQKDADAMDRVTIDE